MKKYFRKAGRDRFEITPRLTKMVKFFQLNLVEQDYPSQVNNTHAIDVIFCRNVLMYFNEHTRQRVIMRLFQALREGGWLIMGPSETAFVQQPGLNAVRFSGAILHRKGLPRKDDSDTLKLQPVKRRSPGGRGQGLPAKKSKVARVKRV